MEIDTCDHCDSQADVMPVGCGHCGFDKMTAWLCKPCSRVWVCPTCNRKPWASYALTFALDDQGLPLVVDLDEHGNPPDGAMKVDPSLSTVEILDLYLTFRRAVLERQSVDERTDPFLERYGATHDETGNVRSSSGDSQQTGIIDTFVMPGPRPLRVVSWNLQDLGGGPSRGPRRSEKAIRRIARVIAELDPDICVLLEVKLAGRLPPKPKPPPEPRQTRNTSKRELQQKIEERRQEYLKELAEWTKKYGDAEALKKQGTSPGEVEVGAIMAQLPLGYSCLLDPSMYTQTETYAFIYKTADIRPVSWGLIDKDKSSGPLYWPEMGYRSPARVTFELTGDRVGRRKGKIDENWLLDVIAFHAPSPTHGEKVLEAIEKFALIDWPRETVFAGDFNIDTEFGDIDHTEKYEALLIDEIDNRVARAKKDEDLQKLWDEWCNDYEAWRHLKFNETLDHHREAYERLFSDIDGALKETFPEHWVVGWDIERTSLRAKIDTAKQEHKEGGVWTSTLAFQNAAYDKIVLLTPKGCDPDLLHANHAFAYPLFERFLPTNMRSLFELKVIDDGVIQRYREDVIDPGTGSSQAKLECVLGGVKELSDHVPVVLDLEIHPAKGK